eukprot:5475653-Amphidinium_carterae.1
MAKKKGKLQRALQSLEKVLGLAHGGLLKKKTKEDWRSAAKVLEESEQLLLATDANSISDGDQLDEAFMAVQS